MCDDTCYRSWMLAAETNNLRGWRTVPLEFVCHVENYMTGGQYEQDLNFTTDAICSFVDNDLTLSNDGLDAWILDVDDTCLSNLPYHKTLRFGCDPFDPARYRAWMARGECLAISSVLRLFNKLIQKGFKVFLVTGRTKDFEQVTLQNLAAQGFVGFESLILRTSEYKGQSAVGYKTKVREDIVSKGYRICGNVGDQWSDLQGDYVGIRTFKLPNPMYSIS